MTWSRLKGSPNNPSVCGVLFVCLFCGIFCLFILCFVCVQGKTNLVGFRVESITLSEIFA